MTRNAIKTLGFIRAAFVVAAGIPFLTAVSALAQDPSPAPAGGTAEVERVIVVGSNIPTAEEVGANPVLNINRDLINKSGERNTEQLLRDLPVANGNGVPISNNATGFTPGASSISLRGFDPSATLVLVDGKRVAPYPAGQSGTSSFIDLFTIPRGAIESIEILKDGASSTYGADAVAGVVNIKLYKQYHGAESTIEYGNTLDKDAAIYSGDVLFGTGDDKTQVVGELNFYHHNSLFNRDRGNSANPPFLSTNANPYNLQLNRDTVLPAIGLMMDPIPNLNRVDNPAFFDAVVDSTGATKYILNAAGFALVGHNGGNGGSTNSADNMASIPGTSKLAAVTDSATGARLGVTPRNLIFGTAPDGTDGTAFADEYHFGNARVRGGGGGAPPLPGFNFNAFSGSFPTSERWGGYTAFSHKVCEDQLVIYADMFYQNVKTHNELAPGATGSFQTPGQVTLAIPSHSPVDPGMEAPGTPTHAETNVPADAYNPFNPFDQILSGGSRARLIEFGNRLFDNESDAFRSTVGIKGDKLFDGNWGYDAGFVYSQIKNTSQGTLVSTSRFNRIVNAADPIFDPNSNQFIGTTIPFNPFGDFHVPIPSNALPVGFATVHPKDIDTSKLAAVDINIYTVQLFNLPAGPVGFAVGGQFRRENIIQDPDQLNVDGDIVGSSKEAITHAGRKDYAFYAETQVPIVSPTMAVPGFHSLEFTAAGRFEAFENNNTNVLVPKVGLRWQPFDDQLTVRSTWGEGFREPSLFELFSSPTFGLQPTTFNGNAEPETASKTSSNPNLQPEDSRAWSGGVVWTPKFIPVRFGTVTLSVDLWDIERSGVVVAPTAQEVVKRFESGHLLPGEIVELDPSGNTVNFVQSSFQNAGRQNARGIDLGLQYQVQTGIGVFQWLTQASYLDSFIFQSTTQSKGTEVSGYVSDSLGGDAWFKWRGISRVDWTLGPWNLNWTVHYLGGFKEKILSAFDVAFNQTFPAQPTEDQVLAAHAHEHYVHQTWFQDAQASYELIFVPPVEPQPVAGYSKGGKDVTRDKDGKAIESAAAYSMPCWKMIFNNTKWTIGVNNIFGQDPPKQYGFEFGNANNYPAFEYDNVGRFVYVELTKKF